MTPAVFILMLSLALALPAQAEEVLAGLSQNRVSITANFDGSEILIFGAVKRDSQLPESGEPLQVVVAVAGPSAPVTVRRKERRFGIWVNSDAVEIDSAPSFYAVATSGRFSEVLGEAEDRRYRISVARAIRPGAALSASPGISDFIDALIRIRKRDRHYLEQPYTVIMEEQTLFRTKVVLPASLTEGDYAVRIFLTRDGYVIDWLEKKIFVQKVGLERFLYSLAHERPLAYGILSLFIAVLAGCLASAAFRTMRN